MISGITLHIEIGGAVVQRCPRLEIVSVRHHPLDLAYIHVPDPSGEAEDLFTYGEPVEIQYGHRGGDVGTWRGSLRGLQRVSRDQVCLIADSEALPLAATFVTECYADESSRAVARYMLQATGLPVGKIIIPDETIPRFPLSTVPVWQAVNQLLFSLHTGFGYDMTKVGLWLGADGVNLGDFDEPGDVPVIATAENLIRHQPNKLAKGRHTVETTLLPGFSHSRSFHLRDTRQGVDQRHRAQVVKHVIEPKSVRTILKYGRERL